MVWVQGPRFRVSSLQFRFSGPRVEGSRVEGLGVSISRVEGLGVSMIGSLDPGLRGEGFRC